MQQRYPLLAEANVCLHTVRGGVAPVFSPTKETHMSFSDSAREIPGVAAAEGAVLGATATEEDLPIKGGAATTSSPPRTSPRS